MAAEKSLSMQHLQKELHDTRENVHHPKDCKLFEKGHSQVIKDLNLINEGPFMKTNGEEKEANTDDGIIRRIGENILTNLKPIVVNEHHRKFANPLSYLGGPRLPSKNRWSIESVMSLD